MGLGAERGEDGEEEAEAQAMGIAPVPQSAVVEGRHGGHRPTPMTTNMAWRWRKSVVG